MADISRYSVLNLMRSSTDVIHNLLFVCHYFILWCQVLNICLCPLYPALHMTPVYEEEVHAPIFILAASLFPQRKSGLEYFISKVYGSLEQPCWLSGAEVLILTMAMQCKSCELIEGYMYYREPTSRTRFLISVNWKFLNHSTHKIGGLHWWFNMSSKMTTSWPWKELHTDSVVKPRLHVCSTCNPAYLRVNLDKADLIQEVLAVVVEEVGEQPDCLHLLAGVSIRVTCRDASIAASTSCSYCFICQC